MVSQWTTMCAWRFARTALRTRTPLKGLPDGTGVSSAQVNASASTSRQAAAARHAIFEHGPTSDPNMTHVARTSKKTYFRTVVKRAHYLTRVPCPCPLRTDSHSVRRVDLPACLPSTPWWIGTECCITWRHRLRLPDPIPTRSRTSWITFMPASIRPRRGR